MAADATQPAASPAEQKCFWCSETVVSTEGLDEMGRCRRCSLEAAARESAIAEAAIDMLSSSILSAMENSALTLDDLLAQAVARAYGQAVHSVDCPTRVTSAKLAPITSTPRCRSAPTAMRARGASS